MSVSPPLRILAISGSLRARSSNTELLRALAAVSPPTMRVALYDGLAEIPPFNPDLDEEGAVPPPAVKRLRSLIDAADGVAICSPEYAHGVPGTLKNALDWLVSGFEIPDKPIALIAASARSHLANASLAETLRTMSTVPVPEASCTVALDGRRLDAAAIVADPELARTLSLALAALEAAARRYREQRPVQSASAEEFWRADLNAATGRLTCSFCRKSQDEVRKLIAGPDVHICDECVDLCSEILERDAEPTTSGVTPPPQSIARCSRWRLSRRRRGVTASSAPCNPRAPKSFGAPFTHDRRV